MNHNEAIEQAIIGAGLLQYPSGHQARINAYGRAFRPNSPLLFLSGDLVSLGMSFELSRLCDVNDAIYFLMGE